jgi:hypothetical protein
MNFRSVICSILLATFLLALIPTVIAEDEQSPTVIYQTTFSTDPRWQTNNPSSDYWDSNLGMYHFSIEPSTGNYAYIPVDYERGPFTLEYDLILNRVDESINEGASFRLGLSGTEMDPSKGPIVLTQFTNAKFGQIMWLRLVTNGNKLTLVNSQNADTAYKGPTVKYELNKTYHVAVTYEAKTRLLSMKVNEKTSGKDVWSYYVNVADDLHGMNRIFIGSVGDYGMMGLYATGYIDNVRLTVPAPAATPTMTVQETAITTRPTPIPTTAQQPIGTVPTAYAEDTPQSPSSAILPVAAFGIVGICIGLFSLRSRE